MGRGGSRHSVLHPSGSHPRFYICRVGAHFQGEHSSTANLQAEHTEGLTHRARARQVERLRRTNSFSGRGHRERSLSRSNSSRIEEMHRERLELLICMSVLDTFNVTLASSPLFLKRCSSWVAQAWSHPLHRHCCWSFLSGSAVSKLLSQVL